MELEQAKEQGIIVDDPLDIKHMLIKYYWEEIIDSITIYMNGIYGRDYTTEKW